MEKETLQEQLDLLSEARNHVERMKKGSAFVTDFRACRLLEKLLIGYQELLAENLKLKKRAKIQKLMIKKNRALLDKE